MVSTLTTFSFTSPKSLKQYTMSIYEDGRVMCSCPSFGYRGSCYHTALPANRDRAFYEHHKAIKGLREIDEYIWHEPTYAEKLDYALGLRPSQRLKLTDLFPDN